MYYIYILYFDGITDCYIGTTKNLKNRMKHHLNAVKYYMKNQKVYQFIRDNNLKDSLKMEILHTVDTECLQESKIVERMFIDLIEPSLNTILPCRTREEYFRDNKQEIYRRRNTQNLTRREKYKELSKQYYYDNKQSRLKKHKEYIKTPKGIEALKKRHRKVNCICGQEINFSRLKRHCTKTKHKNKFLEILINSKSKLKYSPKNIDIRI
tara:strand:+ start:16698 stop:17327 length:630 start_codon:yes stop_codon:yes gene_type:complete